MSIYLTVEKKHHSTNILDGSSPVVSLCVSKASCQLSITEYLSKKFTSTRFSHFIGVLPKPSVFVFNCGCSISLWERYMEGMSAWNNRREWNKQFAKLLSWLRIILCSGGILDKKSRHSDNEVLVMFFLKVGNLAENGISCSKSE